MEYNLNLKDREKLLDQFNSLLKDKGDVTLNTLVCLLDCFVDSKSESVRMLSEFLGELNRLIVAENGDFERIADKYIGSLSAEQEEYLYKFLKSTQKKEVDKLGGLGVDTPKKLDLNLKFVRGNKEISFPLKDVINDTTYKSVSRTKFYQNCFDIFRKEGFKVEDIDFALMLLDDFIEILNENKDCSFEKLFKSNSKTIKF